MADVNELRQVLKRNEKDGVNLYDHVTQVFLKLMVERPANAADVFEQLSLQVREENMAGNEAAAEVRSEDQKAAQLAWTDSCSALLKVADEKPEGFPAFPDLLADAGLWEWAGVSFGRDATYRLYLSVKQLAESLPGEHESVRFWGKIHTRAAGYYVVEARSIEEEEVDPFQQEAKDGVNRFSYWVTTNPDGGASAWTKLPSVTMEQIVVSRKICRLLTGNLDAAVPSHPPFPGTEKNLLRAQIARIGASTCVSPAGHFEEDGEAEIPTIRRAGEEAMAEPDFVKTSDELKSADAWTHHDLEINVLGRQQALPEREDEDGNPIEQEDPPEVVPPVRSLAEDVEGSWAFRVGPSGAGGADHSAVVARSMVWPGAYAIAQGRRFVNIYVGYGQKFSASTFTPQAPLPVQSEWAPPEEDGEGEALVEQADVTVQPVVEEEDA